MPITDFYKKFQRVYDKLQDNESKILFTARANFLLDKNKEIYIDQMLRMYSDWTNCHELLKAQFEPSSTQLIIYGCGHDGQKQYQLLKTWKYNVTCFCDNSIKNTVFDNIPILSVEEAINMYPNALWIISSRKYKNEMIADLQNRNISDKNILDPRHGGFLFARRGKQYFDFFPSSNKEELFIDAGCFDGQTIHDFFEWSANPNSRVISFEPMKAAYLIASDRYRHDSRVQIYNYATWDKKEQITFSDTGSSSHPNPTGTITVEGRTIDSIVGSQKVTFLKMDIEGSELKALQGAKNTIICNTPKLAISIYHNPEDFIQLSSYILDLVPEYKLYIRQYNSDTCETVLYATL